jgi:PAS domain S-box-containing protein/putative nucleotidyltransferase with HDIG domain
MGMRLNLLIIEDSEDDALLLLHELRRSDFDVSYERVDTALDMEEALLRGNWDVIIADYQMPQFSAPAALALMKRHHEDLPFIIVSGKIGEEIAVESLKSGAHDFIVKGNLARLVPAVVRELRESVIRRERKKADEALRKLSRAVEQTADAVIITSSEGQIEYVNNAFEQLTGYRADEVLGLTPRILKSGMHPEGYYAELWSAITAGNVYRSEMINRKKNGELYYQEEIITPIRDSSGSITHFVSTGRDVTDRKNAEDKIAHQYQRLTTLREIDKAITTSLDRNLTFSVILDQIISKLNVDAALVLQHDRKRKICDAVSFQGFRDTECTSLSIKYGFGLPALACRERSIQFIPVIAESRLSDELRFELLEREAFVSYLAVPLMNKGQVEGILEIFSRKPLHPDSEWLQFLESIAEQTSIAMSNAKLIEDLKLSNRDLAIAYETTLEGWSKALDLRDQETEGHTQRVTEMSLRLAQKLGLSENDLISIRRGALLHDIGKMGIPDSILLKPGPLSQEEWDIMRRHPLYAFELLSPIAYLDSAIDIPHYHHEKWDGTGYPYGLKGPEIPIAARIFSIIDVWDALSSDRPYRKGWPMEKVQEYIKNEAGAHFDPSIVQEFLNLDM